MSYSEAFLLEYIVAVMSRAFHPPDSLSKEDIRTIADVRRDIWTNGMSGLVIGAVSGYVIHGVSKFLFGRLSDSTKNKLTIPGEKPIRFTRNTAFLSVMIGGAVGSFAYATAAGKNKVHKLHPIYEVGKDPTAGKTPYQVNLAKAQDEEFGSLNDRVRRRLSRRSTVKKRIEEGQGLTNSHGGQWVQENGQNISTDDDDDDSPNNISR